MPKILAVHAGRAAHGITDLHPSPAPAPFGRALRFGLVGPGALGYEGLDAAAGPGRGQRASLVSSILDLSLVLALARDIVAQSGVDGILKAASANEVVGLSEVDAARVAIGFDDALDSAADHLDADRAAEVVLVVGPAVVHRIDECRKLVVDPVCRVDALGPSKLGKPKSRVATKAMCVATPIQGRQRPLQRHVCVGERLALQDHLPPFLVHHAGVIHIDVEHSEVGWPQVGGASLGRVTIALLRPSHCMSPHIISRCRITVCGPGELLQVDDQPHDFLMSSSVPPGAPTESQKPTGTAEPSRSSFPRISATSRGMPASLTSRTGTNLPAELT